VIYVWHHFGFRHSPYTTEPMPLTEEGDQLLVGREAEIARLESRILSGGNHPTLEGDNGVGRTSLLGVAYYRLRRDFEQGKSSKLFSPIEDFFQPTADCSVDDFIKKVCDDKGLLKEIGRSLELSPRCANLPQVSLTKETR
jgi:hypothetical protein